MSPKDCAYIVERLAIRFMDLVADHERQLSEHGTSFGARTEADAKIIAGLRGESAKYKTERDHFYQREGIEQKRRMDAESERDVLLTQVQNMRAEIKQRAKEQDQDHKTIVSLMSERDGLRVQVQDMREEIIRVNEAHGRTKVEHDGLLDELAVQRDAFTANVERIRRELCEGRDALRAEVAALQERLRASIARGDFAQMEVAALKSQNPKQHPVKVGEWVRRTKLPGDQSPVGIVKQVTSIRCDGDSYGFADGDFWSVDNCEPCDPPATHDTDAGKAAAESALKTEPVERGDLVMVFQATGSMTDAEDIGCGGVVHRVDVFFVWLDRTDTMGLPREGIASLGDVRKVTT